MSAPPSNPADRRSSTSPAREGGRPSMPSARELVAAQERREQELWRWCLLLLVLLAVALGAQFAQELRELSLRFAALPVLVVALIAWVAVLAWRRRVRVVSARRELV